MIGMHILCGQAGIMIEFIIGQAGSGKSTMMFGRIKTMAEKGAKQVILVPEQYSYEFDKNLYDFIGPEKFNELYSLSFTGLARQLFQLYGEPDRNGEYADELARMILIYQAIDTVRNRPESLRFFRRQSSQSGFAEELLTLISDMKRSGIHPELLMEKALLEEDRLRDKTLDVAGIYFEYEQLMREYGFKDSLENIREAAKTANLNRYFCGKEVYLDEFESFTGDQLEMLRYMISSAENVTITLRTDDVNAGEYTLFESVNTTFHRIADICRELNMQYKVTSCGRSHRFMYPDLEYMSGHIMRSYKKGAGDVPAAEHITVFEARDMYSEAEYVCATIKRLICADSALGFRDIAILSNDIAAYAAVLKAAFERYDIPYFLSIERPVNHTAIMVFFSSLLDLLTAKKLRTEHIFRILKSGILDYSLTDVSLLENYCYKWGIDGEMWAVPFAADDSELELLEGMRDSFFSPILSLRKKLGRKITAEKACRLLYEYLISCGAEKNTGRLMGALVKNDRDFEASELKRLWGCLIDILDSISDTLGEREVSFSELSAMIRSMISRITYSVPPQTLDSVIAASARTARLNSPRIVFVMGANDGDFPNNVSVHGLFSENDKLRLSKSGIEISRPLSDLIASERLIVYKSLSAASERFYITYPLSDLSGQAKYPAPPVDQILSMFGKEVLVTEQDIPPHYYGVTMHSAFYHYMQERNSDSVSVASLKKILMSEPEYRRRTAYVLSRSGYTQDFHVDTEIMQKLKSFEPLRLSPSNLEEYDLCHFKYFCNKCLRLQTCEKVELDARISGELIHECFRSILGSRSKNDFVTMSYDEIKGAISRCADKYRTDKLAGEFGKNARFELMYNKLTERLGDVMLHTQHALMNTSFVPDKYELDLRKNSPVVLRFGGDKKLFFGGIIDRADVCDINGGRYLRIVDYKSSRKTITPETLAGGVNLQMLLYLFASTDNGGIYEDCRPAGVLYSPIQLSEVKLEPHRIEGRNEPVIESGLRTSGLVLEDMDVLEAMETGVEGRFIPVKLTASGEIDRRSSGCISGESMGRLRDYVYGELREMAESLLSGDAEAVPLITGKDKPCDFCEYVNICGNSKMERYRLPEAEKLAEAEEILGKKDKGRRMD